MKLESDATRPHNRHLPNPFSTRFVRAGAIDYRFDNPAKIGELVTKFQEHGFVGQIVGPHGSGKSTLAISLARHVSTHFSSVRATIVDARYQARQAVVIESIFSTQTSLLILDGIECLPWSQRLLIYLTFRASTRGLIVTTHRRLPWYPVLHLMQPTCHAFRQLALSLNPSIDSELVERVYQQFGPNIREAMMALYDDWERTHAALER